MKKLVDKYKSEMRALAKEKDDLLKKTLDEDIKKVSLIAGYLKS